jgi:hypothetical protein
LPLGELEEFLEQLLSIREATTPYLLPSAGSGQALEKEGDN